MGAVIALEMVCLEYKDLRNLGMISLMRNLVALELDFHGSKSKLGRVFITGLYIFNCFSWFLQRRSYQGKNTRVKYFSIIILSSHPSIITHNQKFIGMAEFFVIISS